MLEPKKGGTDMNRKVKKLLSLVLLVVFLVSTGILVSRSLASAQAEDTYSDAAALARPVQTATSRKEPVQKAPEENLPLPAEEPRKAWVPVPVEDDPVMDTLAATDLQALRETNPDVVGWIYIPDTRIDYPLMQGQRIFMQN